METVYVSEKTRHFQKRKAEIQDFLQRLTTECEALCNQDPDDLNWAQIGDMERMSTQLRELVERN